MPDLITLAEIPPALAAAIVAAQRAARSVGKGAEHDHHGYKYTSAEQMLAEVGPALSSNGLALLQVGQCVGDWAEGVIPGKYPKSIVMAPVALTHLLVHESGEALLITSTTPAVVDAGRTHDKAVFAARTEAIGYALRDVTAVSRGGSTDVSGRVDSEPVKRTALDWVRLVLPDMTAGRLDWQLKTIGTTDPLKVCAMVADVTGKGDAVDHARRISAGIMRAAGLDMLDTDDPDVRLAVAVVAALEWRAEMDTEAADE